MSSDIKDVNSALLLVDDDDDAVVLFKRAFREAGLTNELHVVRADDEAMQYLEGKGKFGDRRKYPFPTRVL